MLKVRTYFALGLVAYMLFMMVLFPVSRLEPTLKQLFGSILQLSSIDGFIGKAEISYNIQEFPEIISKGHAYWQWHAASLLRLQFGAVVSVKHPGASLSAIVGKGFGTTVIRSVNGQINTRFINQFLKSNGVEMTGEVLIEDFSFGFGKDIKDILTAEGTILYPGGRAKAPKGRREIEVDMPALVGRLQLEDDRSLVLDVLTQNGEEKVGFARIGADGWGEISVLKRFLHLIDQAEDHNDGDKPFFNVKQKVL